ncbi:hypothetical protein MCOR19_009777 [Pyricularia oryzae]|nr:hypothetical protein MCOR19_009777 [Pyricularia oryzae]
MRVPCRLPDQDTMHGTKPELRPTEPSIELSEDVKERLRAAGDVEGFGRSQVWETAVCAGRLDGQDYDKLYTTGEDGGETVVDRALRPISQRIRVWYGRIGFGEKLVKDARKRDQLRDEYDFIGFEMEAAGTMNRIPVGVIRGVCDYGDLHKNKRWQPYAAAMAAAYAKAVLAAIPAKASFASIPTAPSPVANPPHSIFYGPIIGQKVIAGTSMQGTNTINFS